MRFQQFSLDGKQNANMVVNSILSWDPDGIAPVS